MQSPFLLTVVEQEQTTSLRKRMCTAGCVFEFVVFSPKLNIAVDEHVHRQALLGMGCYQAAAYRTPELAETGDYLPSHYAPIPDWDVERAEATPLTLAEVKNLTVMQKNLFGPTALYSAFCHPPYSARFKRGESEAQSLYCEWLQLLGIEAQNDVVVINWVDAYEEKWGRRPDGSLPVERPWDGFFEWGLEWWGIWCLTVWNPRKSTLSVLVASTSD
ncbi:MULTISPECIES: hypothetical protein [unclassified Pseudomonas]|uniref:hypothetical protein n=1 Tax=unclassified Pseudomonas TaxID=196821 RepID=UPI000F57D5C0|nr:MULTISPECIES: hypothetical protein [unclassified Pseudomonas]AZF48271.1 hypothetical protein C4J86_3038 [Pseudomonas sp. R2-7-07]AZF58778.1 hypothetical protein C4J84_2903 [Pseudomonas sp. R11-23-07]